jgi:hypothetical protein
MKTSPNVRDPGLAWRLELHTELVNNPPDSTESSVRAGIRISVHCGRKLSLHKPSRYTSQI